MHVYSNLPAGSAEETCGSMLGVGVGIVCDIKSLLLLGCVLVLQLTVVELVECLETTELSVVKMKKLS